MKVKPPRFVDGADMVYEQRRRETDNPNFVLNETNNLGRVILLCCVLKIILLHVKIVKSRVFQADLKLD